MRAHFAFVFTALASLGACTFPSVEYRDGGAGGGAAASSTGGDCVVAAKCADEAGQCMTIAANKHDACVNKCKQSDASCKAECDAENETNVDLCETKCRACGMAEGCPAPTASCQELVGR